MSRFLGFYDERGSNMVESVRVRRCVEFGKGKEELEKKGEDWIASAIASQ